MRKRILRTFAAAFFVSALFAVNAASASAESATVTGEGVNVRTGPGINYRVVDCLSKGSTVDVTDRSNSSWYAVTTWDGTEGFMSSGYLRLSGSSGGEERQAPSEDTGGDAWEGSRESGGANGYINAMYVRFRDYPSLDGGVLGEYNRGKELTITGETNGWTACVIDGEEGYVYSLYVSSYDDEEEEPEPPADESWEEPEEQPQDDSWQDDGYEDGEDDFYDPYAPSAPRKPKPSPTPSPSPAPDRQTGDGGEQEDEAPPAEGRTGVINGNYVNFRTGPSTSYRVIDCYDRGTQLTATGTSGEWTACVIYGQEGYIFSQYVTLDDVDSQDNWEDDGYDGGYEEEAPPQEEPEERTAEPGYITGNNVRFRSGPSMSSDVLGELFYGNAVTITGTSGDWTAVEYDGEDGYVFSQYVSRGEYQAPSKKESAGGTELGREVANYALQFVGTNYAWGGATPQRGFDCSGLVYYVYQQFGYTLNRVANDQARNGVHVDSDDLQPGDVLCFYSSGSYIGHVGLYIGDGMFVHAQNSATGVVISELSGYYATRGYEARRIIVE